MDAKVFLAQLIGGAGIALLIATFQVDKRSTILKVQVASCLAWALYYLLMGAVSGAGMAFLAAVRCFVFDRYRQHEWLLEVCIVVYAVMTLAAWTSVISMLPFFGTLMATVALWQESPRSIRFISLTPTAFWFPYNLMTGSYVGMAGDFVTISSVIIGIVRFDIVPHLKATDVPEAAKLA